MRIRWIQFVEQLPLPKAFFQTHVTFPEIIVFFFYRKTQMTLKTKLILITLFIIRTI